MKKKLSFLLAVALVFSCVSVFSSCDRDPEPVDASTVVSDSETSETYGETSENTSAEQVSAEQWYDEQFVGSQTEHTTNSNYQADYDALTLPSAVETTASDSSSENGETSATKTPQFTSGNATESTTKTDTKDPTKENTSTTKKEQSTDKETTTSADSEDTPGTVTPSVMPRPNVTYFDKYVKSVLNSGNYTATVVGNFRGYSATVNIYKNGATAYNISTVYHSVPVSGRYFYSGGNVYIIVPAMMSYAVVDVADPIVGTLESIVASESVAMTADGMAYCGLTSGTGYVCETYKDTDGTVYNYYFNNGGLTKIVVSGSSGTSTISVSLKSGVSAGGVFSVPSSYKKVDVQVFIDKFESL